MKHWLPLVCWLALCSATCRAQAYKNFSVNAGLDVTSAAKQAILAHWDAYLGSGFKMQAGFWAPEELRRYPKGDLLLSEGYVNPSVYEYQTEKIVLSLEQVDTALYRCRTLFYWHNGTAPLTIFCQVSTYFEQLPIGWRLVNYLTRCTRDWQSRTVGQLTYQFPAGRPFSAEKAALAERFLASMFRDFSIAPFPVTYYLAGSCEEAQHLKGFDYVIGLGNGRICGFYDQVNHLVYAGSLDEAYYHELVHVINPYFPRAHPLLLTGYAALRGGHFGHDLAYHKRRVAAYLVTHPVDLHNPLAFTNLDEQTNPQYVIGGLFCEYALQQGGLPGLKRLFGYGTTDADFYRALEQEFKLTRQALPRFIRQQLGL